jgi:prevent-host-death family protein
MEQHGPSVKTINALKARQNLGQLLEEVFYQEAQFIIERAGKPMAAVVPVSQFEEWQKQHGRPKTSADTSKAKKGASNKRRT